MSPQNTILHAIPSDSVREAATQDGAVLLDIREGRCLGITPTGMEIWQGLKAKRATKDIITSLIDRYPEVGPELIEKDVHQFLAALRSKRLLSLENKKPDEPVLTSCVRLLHPHSSQVKSTALKEPKHLLLKALLGLLIFDVFRFGSNFTRIHKAVRDWPVADRKCAHDIARHVSRAMNYAYVWYPKRVRCLQRAAVMTCLLRNCGLNAQMVIGVRKMPFKAHAWTELGGQVLNERRNVQDIYLVWERC